eukprot:358671-Chlamydomonas_euryale.AAC.8
MAVLLQSASWPRTLLPSHRQTPPCLCTALAPATCWSDQTASRRHCPICSKSTAAASSHQLEKHHGGINPSAQTALRRRTPRFHPPS